MDNQVIIAGLMAAKSEINHLRFRYTQFTLPMADSKLININNYLSQQISDLERKQWAEAEVA